MTITQNVGGLFLIRKHRDPRLQSKNNLGKNRVNDRRDEAPELTVV